MKYRSMSKQYLLAAETYAYSYANYADHLGINERFDKLMPKDIDVLENLVAKGMGAEEVAAAFDLSLDEARELLASFLTAKEIVYAKNAAESFRRGVKASIQFALRTGLNNGTDIDDLVTQICYRASDLGYLLDLEGKQLSDYSEVLRAEK